MVLARRDRAYIPQNFYQVIFSLEGSAIPTVLPRSIPIIIVDIAAAVLDHLKIEDEDGQQRSYASYFAVPNEIIIPFALLIGLLFSFRISSAYEKWVKACEVTKQFHGRVCLITSRIAISVCQGSDSEIAGSTRFLGPKAAGTLEMVRRLLLLSFVCMLKDMTGDDNYEPELACGLLQQQEHDAFKAPTTFAGPSKDRPVKMQQQGHSSVALHMAEQATHAVLATRDLHISPSRARIDHLYNELATVFDQVELLAMTMLPLEYAQASRLACLIFLILLPFSAVESLHWGAIPIAMLANIVFLSIDESASDMEAPFGMDETDVDLESAVRATDVQSAAMLGAMYGTLVPHFDLYRPANEPEGAALNRSLSVYQLERSKSENSAKLRVAVKQVDNVEKMTPVAASPDTSAPASPPLAAASAPSAGCRPSEYGL